MKREKGITLVALVITIIVLIILVGVSIATLMNDNGIIPKVLQAKQQTKIEAIIETIKVFKTNAGIEKRVNEEYKISFEDVVNDLINKGIITKAEEKNMMHEDDIIYYCEGNLKTEVGTLVIESVDLEEEQESKPEPKPDPEVDETFKVNKPVIEDGMIPIKWNGSKWEICSQDDEKWYDYDKNEWANIMLAEGTLTANDIGTEVEYDKLGSMFVWIPRFAYRITSGYHENTNNGVIETRFVKINNESQDNIKIINKLGANNWNIPSAFKFGEEEIPGFYVAKFEATYSGHDVKVLLGKPAWKGMYISNMFKYCLDMNGTESNATNIHGINGTKTDTHMLKNTEWGAVAYLTYSLYGKAINKNYSNTTGGGYGEEYVKNIAQSTTGNITGVYDMSGGTDEYVAAYVNNGNNGIKTYGANMIKLSEKDKTKYIDVYRAKDYPESRDSNYKENYEQVGKECFYGDAIYETSGYAEGAFSWNGEFSYFPATSYAFITRGGDNTRLLAFNSYSGACDYYCDCGFRPTLSCSTPNV